MTINISRILESNGETNYIDTQSALSRYGFSQRELDRWVLSQYLTPKKDRKGFLLWDVDELERMAERLKPTASMDWISLDEVERVFGIGFQMLSLLAKEKIVTPRQVSSGGEWFFKREDLQAFANEFPEY
jgi:hypothetical protein